MLLIKEKACITHGRIDYICHMGGGGVDNKYSALLTLKYQIKSISVHYPQFYHIQVHNGITGETMDHILNYIYSTKLNLDRNNVQDILLAANYFSLTEIVDSCVQFILENLDVSTSVSLLLFAWQLDIHKLSEGLIGFVTSHFSYFLVTELKEQLFALPITLIVMLLSSDSLLLRDKSTNLPTRPAEREKQVLGFILEYTNHRRKNKEDVEEDEMQKLLTCVRWTILHIFDQHEFVSTTLTSLIDNQGQRDNEISKYHQIKHSDWFLKSSEVSSSLLTQADKQRYSTRAFSCSERVRLEPMAGGNETRGCEHELFSAIAKPDEHIKQLDVIINEWQGKRVVGGMSLHFASSDGERLMHVGADSGTSLHVVHLHAGEHIKSVFGRAGWFVDVLTFETTEGRCFGPYGGDGGEEKDLMKTITRYREEGIVYNFNKSRLNSFKCKWGKSIVPGPHERTEHDSLLVGVTGNKVTSQHGDVIVRNLQFEFREMVPTGRFLISKEKKYERSLSSKPTGLQLKISSMVGGEEEGESSSGSENDFEYMHNHGLYWGMEH